MSDIFYYSNYCNHSKRVIEFISKNNIIDKLSCICIDKRFVDPQTNHLLIILENGRNISMPPSVNNVPALLKVRHNHTVVIGSEAIIQYFGEDKQYVNTQQTQSNILQTNVEPISYDFGLSKTDISSEKFSDYGDTKVNQLNNYVEVGSNPKMINAPEDKYKADKLDSGITIDKLMQMRNQDLPQNVNPGVGFSI
jgi:hypothetical protein